MTITVPGFPNTYQTEYARIPKAPLPGDLWEGELFNERPIGGLIANVTEVAYAATVTIAAFNSGDQVGVTINGVTIPVTAVTDAPATAALLNTAINAAALLSGVVSSTVAGAVLTLTGALGVSVTVTEYSPDATTAAVTGVTASVVQQQLDFGYGVVKDVPSLTVNRNAIKKPTSASDKFVGVLVRTSGGQIPRDQIDAAGFDPDYLMPGMTYATLRQNVGVVVEYVGTAPTESDSVYLIFSGTSAGKWRINDGSTSQITTGTVVPTNGDTVGLTIDSLPNVTVTSTASATDTAVLLRDAINARADLAAIVTATSAVAVLTLTFLDDSAHTVVAVSPATADVTPIANTATAVAASAMLIADYSWGAPSIPGSADLPARAFLRLSPS